MHIKHNGGWLEAFPFLKHNGKWVETEPLLKNSGKWVSVGEMKTDFKKISEKTFDIESLKINGTLNAVHIKDKTYAMFTGASKKYYLTKDDGITWDTKDLPMGSNINSLNRSVFYYNGNYFIGLKGIEKSYAALERVVSAVYRTSDFEVFTKVGEMKSTNSISYDYINEKMYCCDYYKCYSYDFNGVDTIKNETLVVDFEKNKGPLKTNPDSFFKDYNTGKYYVGSDYGDFYSYNINTNKFELAWGYAGVKLVSIKNKNYFIAAGLKGTASTTNFMSDLTIDRERNIAGAVESYSENSDFTTFDVESESSMTPDFDFVIMNKKITFKEFKRDYKKPDMSFEVLSAQFSYIENKFTLIGSKSKSKNVVNTDVGPIEFGNMSFSIGKDKPFVIGLLEPFKGNKSIRIGFTFEDEYIGTLNAVCNDGQTSIVPDEYGTVDVAKRLDFILSNLPQVSGDVKGKTISISLTEIVDKTNMFMKGGIYPPSIEGRGNLSYNKIDDNTITITDTFEGSQIDLKTDIYFYILAAGVLIKPSSIIRKSTSSNDVYTIKGNNIGKYLADSGDGGASLILRTTELKGYNFGTL